MNRKLLTLFILSINYSLFGLSFKSEVDYLSYFSNQELLISQRYLSYISETAHGNKLRKIEQKRREVVNALKAVQTNVTKLKPYKGDTLLKRNYETYITMLNSVFNEDYGKIVDLEEIAEQSYDKMEAFLLAQEQADAKLNQAQDQFANAFEKYAAANNIRLLDNKSKLEKKMMKIGQANKYYRQIYLVFFKTFKQEAYLLDAIQHKDVNGVEQNRNTLKKYSLEGLAKLDTARAFKSNQTLLQSAKKYLLFAKNEADKIIFFNEYTMRTDEFDKVKKAYETSGKNKTKEEIDSYNLAVKNINKAINDYNSDMQQLDKNRTTALNYWNASAKAFFETYIPKE
jgi:hypothetical protein